MKTYTLYIGCNNETKELELNEIKRICNIRHDGFTIYNATGAWLGSEEDTAVVIIHDEKSKIIRTISDLKYDLNQDAIGFQESPTLQFA